MLTKNVQTKRLLESLNLPKVFTCFGMSKCDIVASLNIYLALLNNQYDTTALYGLVRQCLHDGKTDGLLEKVQQDKRLFKNINPKE